MEGREGEVLDREVAKEIIEKRESGKKQVLARLCERGVLRALLHPSSQ